MKIHKTIKNHKAAEGGDHPPCGMRIALDSRLRGNDRSRFRRGLETVEAALLLPIILMVTFGALKYGWIFLKSQQLANAARQAARIAIRPALDSTALAEAEIVDRMDEANISGYTYTVSNTTVVGDDVTVQVSVDTVNVDILPTGGWIPTPATLGTTITMCKEGS